MEKTLNSAVQVDGMKAWLGMHDACPQGMDWAVRNCYSLADMWEKLLSDDIRAAASASCDLAPSWAEWVAAREGVLSPRDRTRYALHVLEFPEFQQVIDEGLDAQIIKAAITAARGWLETGELQTVGRNLYGNYVGPNLHRFRIKYGQTVRSECIARVIRLLLWHTQGNEAVSDSSLSCLGSVHACFLMPGRDYDLKKYDAHMREFLESLPNPFTDKEL